MIRKQARDLCGRTATDYLSGSDSWKEGARSNARQNVDGEVCGKLGRRILGAVPNLGLCRFILDRPRQNHHQTQNFTDLGQDHSEVNLLGLQVLQRRFDLHSKNCLGLRVNRKIIDEVHQFPKLVSENLQQGRVGDRMFHDGLVDVSEGLKEFKIRWTDDVIRLEPRPSLYPSGAQPERGLRPNLQSSFVSSGVSTSRLEFMEHFLDSREANGHVNHERFGRFVAFLSHGLQDRVGRGVLSSFPPFTKDISKFVRRVRHYFSQPFVITTDPERVPCA